MKKLLASILLLIYFTVTTGFVVSIHYCMDKVDSVQLGGADGDECGNCGMPIQKSGCCKDDVKLVKMIVDQPVAKTLVADFSISFLPSLPTEFSSASVLKISPAEFPVAHGPPINGPDIYLRNCVFRL